MLTRHAASGRPDRARRGSAYLSPPRAHLSGNRFVACLIGHNVIHSDFDEGVHEALAAHRLQLIRKLLLRQHGGRVAGQ